MLANKDGRVLSLSSIHVSGHLSAASVSIDENVP